MGITATETVANIALEDLLNHTARRILLLQEEILDNLVSVSSVKLIASYGFYRSSGVCIRSMYKKRYDKKNKI